MSEEQIKWLQDNLRIRVRYENQWCGGRNQTVDLYVADTLVSSEVIYIPDKDE